MDRVQLPTELALNMSEYIALLRQYYGLYLLAKQASIEAELSCTTALHCTKMHREWIRGWRWPLCIVSICLLASRLILLLLYLLLWVVVVAAWTISLFIRMTDCMGRCEGALETLSLWRTRRMPFCVCDKGERLIWNLPSFLFDFAPWRLLAGGWLAADSLLCSAQPGCLRPVLSFPITYGYTIRTQACSARSLTLNGKFRKLHVILKSGKRNFIDPGYAIQFVFLFIRLFWLSFFLSCCILKSPQQNKCQSIRLISDT